MKKINLSDEELLIQIFLEDISAFNLMLDRYKNYSKSIVYNYYIQNYNSGISYDNLLSVVPLTFYKAIKKYQLGNNSFYPYFLTLLERDLIEYIKENSYQYKARMFSGSFSFDEEIPHTEEICFKDVIGSFDDQMYVKIEYDEIVEQLNQNHEFDEIEIVILHHLIENDSEAIIAKATNLSKARVHKLINEIRRKLKGLK